MTRQTRSWRVRLAFEPNRYSGEQLERIYEQLKPTEIRETGLSCAAQSALTKGRQVKRGNR